MDSVLYPGQRPPRLGDLVALDGVALRVEVVDRYRPLEHRILCMQSIGESDTLRRVLPTQMRLIERGLLKLHPLREIKPLDPQLPAGDPSAAVHRVVRGAGRAAPRRRFSGAGAAWACRRPKAPRPPEIAAAGQPRPGPVALPTSAAEGWTRSGDPAATFTLIPAVDSARA